MKLNQEYKSGQKKTVGGVVRFPKIMWVMSVRNFFYCAMPLCDVIYSFIRSPGIRFWMLYTGTFVSTGRLERYKLSYSHTCTQRIQDLGRYC